MKKSYNITFLAILVSQALVLHIFEGMIPVPFITPGAKLGLANIVTVIALYSLGPGKTLLVILLRVFLSALLGGSLSGFLYSLTGALFSFSAMYIVKKAGKDKVSIIGVSVCGAVFHNIGQITMAALIIENINISLYLPILSIAGIGTGIFVGITSGYVLHHLNKINKNLDTTR